MAHVVVVGGGIAGLAAARAIAGAGHAVTVLEAEAVLGGKLRTSDIAGCAVDEGADAFLVRVPEALALVEAVGLPLVHPETTSASIWARGRLRPFPIGSVMGVPTSLGSLARSGVVGPAGLARAALDLVRPPTTVAGDPSVGTFGRARLGSAVVDSLVDPLLGGVYAGRVDELSWQATLPQLVPALEGRSLIRAAAAVRGSSESKGEANNGAVFGSVLGGLGTLAAALTADLMSHGVVVRIGATVRQLERTSSGWRVLLGPTTNVEAIAADGVIIAVPGAAAARLLRPVAPHSADALDAIPYASVAIVTLAYAREPRQDSLSGSGFLVPSQARRFVKAVTFTSRKWAHVGTGEAFIVRASVGRHGETESLQRDDVELAGVAAADVAELAGLRGRPIETRVTRWGGALPQYLPGHLDRVATIHEGVAALGGVAVCGAAYSGVGIPACIRSGQAAAAALLREWGHD